MLQDIERHIALIDNAIKWAKEYHKDSFPYEVFKEYRRKVRRIHAALEEKCSVAAYGESQVGKSYLMSSLLSSPNSPFVITNAGKEYSFIDDINPSGGKNSKIESTGVVTRFTLAKGESKMKDYVKIRNLSVVDIILLLTDSYYNDIRINPESVLKYDDINKALEEQKSLWAEHHIQQSEISEDDIKDINDYVRDVIGNAAAGITQSNFCKVVAPIIQYVAYDKWVNLFSLLWNRNVELSRLFSVLINEYKKLNFQTEVYVPFNAVLAGKGTLLKIEWLDTVCGVNIVTGKDKIYTDVLDANGDVIAHDFSKGNLSALIAELTFEIPKELARDRKFLEKMDLLDFPGARSREKYKEADIRTVLPKILRRGKVAYLFNKYSRSLRISSVLFCHHNDQKAEATIGETINSWIEDNIGATPSDRAKMLNDTNGIAPLFLIATKFNIDLERTKTDTPSNIDKLSEHWNRFDTVFPEIIKPNKWLDDWVTEGGLFRTSVFQNIYPLRDFYWSGKNRVFDGYSDGEQKSPEKQLHTFDDYPDYFSNLKRSFMQNEFVKKYFANPEQTWNDVATVSNDGSKAIIRSLDAIAGVLDDARKKHYLSQLQELVGDMQRTLSVYYEPEDLEAKNRKVKQIASDIRLALTLSVGEKPEVFGHIIDSLMIPVGDIRAIAYDIVVRHIDEPADFSRVNFIRKVAGIDASDHEDLVKEKLGKFLMCETDEIDDKLRQYNCSLAEILSNDNETPTTVAGVVAEHIIDYWTAFVNNRAKNLEKVLPHADEVVFMLTALASKQRIKMIISERISRYCTMFDIYKQPNAIADYASLALNNFISSVGREYMTEDEVKTIAAKADKCGVQVDLSQNAWQITQKRQPLLDTLNALETATDINNVPKEELGKLPFWNNFQRWQNLVTIGLLYASDISHVDPKANAAIKELLDESAALYK